MWIVQIQRRDRTIVHMLVRRAAPVRT